MLSDHAFPQELHINGKRNCVEIQELLFFLNYIYGFIDMLGAVL
jgi:hypothetical protein